MFFHKRSWGLEAREELVKDGYMRTKEIVHYLSYEAVHDTSGEAQMGEPLR